MSTLQWFGAVALAFFGLASLISLVIANKVHGYVIIVIGVAGALLMLFG